MKINGEDIVSANSSQLLHSVEKIIAYVSKFATLKMGDLIFTGSPVTEHCLKLNDKVECFLESSRNLYFRVK